MTPKELSKSISELDDPQKFDDIELDLSINGQDKNLKGLATIHEFAYNQKEGWIKIGELPHIIESHKTFYNNLLSIIELVFETLENKDRKSVKNDWSYYRRNHGSNILELNNYSFSVNIGLPYFTYDNPAINFLIDVSNKFSNDVVVNTYYSIIEDPNSRREREQIIASVLAYEFMNKDSDITSRRKQEKLSLDKLRTDLSKSIDGSKENLNEFYSDSKNKIDELAQAIDSIKKEKSDTFDNWYYAAEKHYNEWYENSNSKFTKLYSQSETKVKELENTYQEKLRLSEPVKYWSTRAEDLRKRGDKARVWLIGLIVITVLFLITYICIAPSGLIANIVKGNTDSMKWLLVSITIISFLAYGIRSFNKIMFSSYHLARDAEEREQLTYVYLALYNDNKIDKTERSIVLQALFSRADTGLLKEDSSPTMPGIILEKLSK
jgi:uncharacterized protein YukE